MSDSVLLGSFLWYELLTEDPDGAQGFYTDLIGWGTAPWEEGEGTYTMWTNNDVPVGGLMTLPEEAKKAGAPPHWLAYIGTPDVDDTVSRASNLGGKTLVPAMEMEKVGKFAVLSDPQGAVFAVFTPEQQQPKREGPPQVGEFSWHELSTTEHVAALDFYQTLFGWEKMEGMDMGPLGIYQMYGQNDTILGGMFNKPSEMPGPAHWLFYVTVDDVDRVAERVKETSGRVLNGPMDVPGGGRIAQCMDPQGAAFAVHSSKE